MYSASHFSVTDFDVSSGFFPALAIVAGFAMAATAWQWDQQGKQIYAMSLPIHGWEYALLRMAAGSVALMVPVAALWLGSSASAIAASPPAGVVAYPHSLSLRFLNASVVAYAGWFALFSGRQRHQLIFAGGVLAFFVLSTLLASTFGIVDLSQKLLEFLLSSPGPFEVFTGSWRLLDV